MPMIDSIKFVTNEQTIEALAKDQEDILWQVQLREFPDSKRLTLSQALNWTFMENVERISTQVGRSIAVANQHRVCVWYECGLNPDGTYRYRGCRFGIEGSEYMSGFGRH